MLLAIRESGPIAARQVTVLRLAQGAAFDVSGDVALNSAHRTGDGSDHADVAFNSAFIDPEGYNNSPLKAVLELADVISVETSTGGVFAKVKATLQILKDLIFGGIDYANPVSIVGATVLDATAVGKHHVCSGVGADYLVDLPTAGLTAGNQISFEMALTLVESVILDATAGLAIDGLQLRKMHAGEVALLKWDGVKWAKVSGKFVPYIYSGERTTAVSVPTGTIVQIPINSIFDLSVPSMDVSGYCAIPRAGRYAISGLLSYEYFGGGIAGKETYCVFGHNSVVASAIGPPMLAVVPSSAVTTTTLSHSTFATERTLSAGDFIALLSFHSIGFTADTRIVPAVRPFMTVTEIPSW